MVIASSGTVKAAQRIVVLGLAIVRGGALDHVVGRVTGRLDRGANRRQRRHRGPIANRGVVLQQVDRHRAHAVELADDLLDARRAGGAGHALDRQQDLARPLGFLEAVPGLLDRGANSRHVDPRRIVVHVEALGGEVDGGLGDPVELADDFLDPRRTGAAGHAGDAQRLVLERCARLCRAIGDDFGFDM